MHRPRRAIRPVLVCCAVAAAAACSPPRSASRQPPPITTGLNALATDDTPASTIPPPDPVDAEPDAWEQAALDLQAVLNEQTPPDQPDPPTQQPAQQPAQPQDGPPDQTAPDTPSDQPQSSPPTQPDQARSLRADPQHNDQPADDQPTPAELARQLADRLTGQAPASDDPATDLLYATILTNLWTNTPPSLPAAIALSPSEQTRLAVAATITRALASPDTDTAALLAALDRARTDLTADGSGFVIAHVDLARRVEGFGKYTPFPAHTFLAGKPNRMIVYTEPANFGHRPRTASDRAGSPDARFVVDLSQELTLYHDASPDLQAWHQPKARIVDASRNRQLDYYLINEIVLPANLSVGSYRLKITTHDETTGATAQAAIPIDIVADPALAYGNR